MFQSSSTLTIMGRESYELKRTESFCPTPPEQLLDYVENNEIQKIRNLARDSPNILNTIYEDPPENNILQVACLLWPEKVTATTVKTLIQLGVDLYFHNEVNNSKEVLHFATLSLNPEILRAVTNYIKKSYPDKINSVCYGGKTALNLLAKDGNADHPNFLKCARILVEAGVDVNQADSRNLTPIFWAARNARRDLVEFLLEQPDIDIDSHKMRDKSARDLINEKSLHQGDLPEPVFNNNEPTLRSLMLLKRGQEEAFIADQDVKNHVDTDDGYETLLQIACRKGLRKAVKFLIESNADTNKFTEKKREKPIEIAAQEGFHHIFALLLNDRYTKLPPNLASDLLLRIDSRDVGSRSHKKCWEALVKSDKIVDVNHENQDGFTPLHYAAMYGNSDTTLELLRHGACLANKNRYGVMPVENIDAKTLERHLDNCVTANIDKDSCKVTFDYSSLVPCSARNDLESGDFVFSELLEQLVPETDVVVYMSKNKEIRPLLKHPVITSFLYMKWHKLRWFFYVNLIFYTIYCLSLYMYISLSYNEYNSRNETLAVLFSVILHVTFAALILREVFQMVVSPGSYFLEFENIIEVCLMISVMVMLSQDSPQDETRKQFSAVVVLLSAFELVMLIGQIPELSTNIVMLRTVSWNFFKCLLWYAILLLAFAFSFYILFNDGAKPASDSGCQCNKTDDEEQDFFVDPGTSLFKTIVMLTGEFDASSMKFATFPYTSRIIFITFVFMITIVLFNLLNGLAVSDIHMIKSDAELHGYVARVQHVWYIEKMLLGNVFPSSVMSCLRNICCCFPSVSYSCTALRPIAVKTLLFPTFLKNYKLDVDVSDNGRVLLDKYFFGKCFNVFLDKRTVKRIRSILESKKEEVQALEKAEANSYTMHEIIAEQRKLRELISNLVTKIDNMPRI